MKSNSFLAADQAPGNLNDAKGSQVPIILWTRTSKQSLLGALWVLDFARIGMGCDRDYTIGPAQALWPLRV
jgi:hypothetical protein